MSLVDNMVKLGSLYRGPQDAPLSHRIRNLPSKTADGGSGSSSSVDGGQQQQQHQDKPLSNAMVEENERQAQQRKADIQVGR